MKAMIKKKAFLIVDVQNDFMEGGALAVPDANAIVPLINALMAKFPIVVASKDWHPTDHVSFAINHSGKKIGDVIQVHDMDQVLWPVHCVRNTKGSEIFEGLNKEPIACYFYKGTDKGIDGYSALFDNARLKSTGLTEYLRSRGVDQLYIVGLATDYCVLYSTIDALDMGFSVVVIADACRPINLHPEDEKKALAMMSAHGARIVKSSSILR
jgi:nicotinamidase/pyrazinamidase